MKVHFFIKLTIIIFSLFKTNKHSLASHIDLIKEINDANNIEPKNLEFKSSETLTEKKCSIRPTKCDEIKNKTMIEVGLNRLDNEQESENIYNNVTNATFFPSLQDEFESELTSEDNYFSEELIKDLSGANNETERINFIGIHNLSNNSISELNPQFILINQEPILSNERDSLDESKVLFNDNNSTEKSPINRKNVLLPDNGENLLFIRSVTKRYPNDYLYINPYKPIKNQETENMASTESFPVTLRINHIQTTESQSIEDESIETNTVVRIINLQEINAGVSVLNFAVKNDQVNSESKNFASEYKFFSNEIILNSFKNSTNLGENE